MPHQYHFTGNSILTVTQLQLFPVLPHGVAPEPGDILASGATPKSHAPGTGTCIPDMNYRLPGAPAWQDHLLWERNHVFWSERGEETRNTLRSVNKR